MRNSRGAAQGVAALLASRALLVVTRADARDSTEALTEKGALTPEATAAVAKTPSKQPTFRVAPHEDPMLLRNRLLTVAHTARSRRPRAVRCAAALACVALLATPASRARAAGEQQLIVSGAASLTAAFGAIVPAFTKAHASANVQTNFAGSSTLVQQIREGAPVDVFASADESNMQKLVDAGDVADAPVVFATNRLAILVARGNPKQIGGIADLAKPGLVVSLCGPAVPAGKYAREIFAKAGVTVPPSSQELDVKAVVMRVSLGEADAGIVYTTDVLAAGDEVAAVEIPDALNVVARYPVAVLKRTQQPELARAFVGFLTGSEGRAILKRLGFLPP